MGLLLAVENRQKQRARVVFDAQLREVGGVRVNATMCDLSETGFRADCAFPIAVGQRVFLTIPTFAPLEAIVAWRDGHEYGCKFLRPLYPAVFDTIVARHTRH
jgi:hypothetical protein